MNPLRPLLFTLFGLSSAGAALADKPAPAQLEINALLTEIGASGCEFYRNGTWYDAKRAQAHLHMKYQSLAGGDQVTSAEDFIARVATRSSFTGQPYQIRCRGGSAQAFAAWLREKLLLSRAKGAAGVTRAAPLTDQTDRQRAVNRPS